MNSRKAVSIITKICLSSFQKVLGNLTLLPNHFLILARPIWGCVLQYQHSEKGKKASNLSSCLSITGPWRTATEQVLASLSGLAPATKTSPPRHKFSSTRVLWHFPAREQCHTHTHSCGSLQADTQGTQKSAVLCGQTFQGRTIPSGLRQTRADAVNHPCCLGDSPAIPLTLPSAWWGWNEWLGGWPCWLCVAGIHTAGFSYSKH